MYRWPGTPEKEILICVHKSSVEQELFHRHDFFYFNYTYQGQCESFSYQHDRKIVIRENEVYAGQPFAFTIIRKPSLSAPGKARDSFSLLLAIAFHKLPASGSFYKALFRGVHPF